MHIPVSFGSETPPHPTRAPSIHDAGSFPLGVILITPVTSYWYRRDYDGEGLSGGTRDCCTGFSFFEASEREDLVLSIDVSHQYNLYAFCRLPRSFRKSIRRRNLTVLGGKGTNPYHPLPPLDLQCKRNMSSLPG